MQDKDYRIDLALPESLNRDNMHDVAKTLDEALLCLDLLSEIVCLYPRIDELSSDLIDALAIQFHCEYYDSSLPLEIRRGMVKHSIPWHMRKGTAQVVQEYTSLIAGQDVKVTEWYEYGGKPYYFRVNYFERPVPDRAELQKLVKAINRMKNVRSWLDRIEFTRHIPAPKKLGIAISQFKTVDIPLPQITPPNVGTEKRISMALGILKEVQING